MNAANCDPQTPDCAHCASRPHSIFAELTLGNVASVNLSKICRPYDRGEMIYYAGDVPHGLYCIHQGKIKIYKVGENGREQVVRIVKEGDVFGYRALLNGEAHSDFAAPLEDARVCFVPRDVLFDLIAKNPQMSLNVLSMLSGELKAAEGLIVELAQKPVRERLAETLLLLRQTFGTEDDGVTLDMKMTREELASIVGTATESAIRGLSDFKNEGLIDLKRQKILILDVDRLAEVANVIA